MRHNRLDLLLHGSAVRFIQILSSGDIGAEFQQTQIILKSGNIEICCRDAGRLQRLLPLDLLAGVGACKNKIGLRLQKQLQAELFRVSEIDRIRRKIKGQIIPRVLRGRVHRAACQHPDLRHTAEQRRSPLRIIYGDGTAQIIRKGQRGIG